MKEKKQRNKGAFRSNDANNSIASDANDLTGPYDKATSNFYLYDDARTNTNAITRSNTLSYRNGYWLYFCSMRGEPPISAHLCTRLDYFPFSVGSSGGTIR